MLLVASETGHVYTFATDKLQPMITSEAGKHLIQSCLSYNQDEETTNNLNYEHDPNHGRIFIENFNENEFHLDEEFENNNHNNNYDYEEESK